MGTSCGRCAMPIEPGSRFPALKFLEREACPVSPFEFAEIHIFEVLQVAFLAKETRKESGPAETRGNDRRKGHGLEVACEEPGFVLASEGERDLQCSVDPAMPAFVHLPMADQEKARDHPPHRKARGRDSAQVPFALLRGPR